MKTLKLKPGCKAEVVTMPEPHKYTDMYPLLECDTFDVLNVNIGGRHFDLFIDDESKMKGFPWHVTVLMHESITNNSVDCIVGPCAFFKHDGENTIGLDDDDIEFIKSKLVYIPKDFSLLNSGSMNVHILKGTDAIDVYVR